MRFRDPFNLKMHLAAVTSPPGPDARLTTEVISRVRIGSQDLRILKRSCASKLIQLETYICFNENFVMYDLISEYIKLNQNYIRHI